MNAQEVKQYNTTENNTIQYNTLQHSAHNTLLTDIYRLFNKFLKLVNEVAFFSFWV